VDLEVLDVHVPPQLGSPRREVTRSFEYSPRVLCALRDNMDSGHDEMLKLSRAG
jgi:hypothetical protein